MKLYSLKEKKSQERSTQSCFLFLFVLSFIQRMLQINNSILVVVVVVFWCFCRVKPKVYIAYSEWKIFSENYGALNCAI